MRATFSRWGPPVAVMALIFYLSAQPGLSSGLSLDFYLRKAAHMAIYGALALTLWRALGYRHAAWAALFSVLYAVTDELHQSFVPGRNASVVDVGIDAFGAVLALLIAGWIRRRRTG